MRKILLVLPFLLAILVGPPAQAQVAIERVDAPIACDWTVSNYGTNNGHVLLQNSNHKVNLDYRLQVRRAPGCLDELRGAVNFRCYQWFSGWVPANCGADAALYVFESGEIFAANGISFESTGPDGVISRYSTYWQPARHPELYHTKAFVVSATVAGRRYDVEDGFYGYSHECLYYYRDMIC